LNGDIERGQEAQVPLSVLVNSEGEVQWSSEECARSVATRSSQERAGCISRRTGSSTTSARRSASRTWSYWGGFREGLLGHSTTPDEKQVRMKGAPAPEEKLRRQRRSGRPRRPRRHLRRWLRSRRKWRRQRLRKRRSQRRKRRSLRPKHLQKDCEEVRGRKEGAIQDGAQSKAGGG